MRLPRKHRVLTVLIALFGMLFMQLAVASYVCPGLPSAGAEQSMAAPDDEQGMPDCNQSGSAKSPLCHEHCQDGKSLLDKPEVRTPAPAAVLLSAIFTAAQPVLPAIEPRGDASSLLQRITAPPISIRHCCFRI